MLSYYTRFWTQCKRQELKKHCKHTLLRSFFLKRSFLKFLKWVIFYELPSFQKSRKKNVLEDMNDIKESLVTSIFNWFPNFSSIFNSTEIKGNVEKNFNVDVDKFLSSLTEINSTLSGHIVLILDQVYAGKFSDTLNLVLDRISEGRERY